MNIRRNLASFVVVSSLMLGATGSAFAKDSKGVVTSISIDDTNYMQLRIKLQGIASFCDGNATTPHVAYMSGDHHLYDTILKLVTSAYLAGKQITIRAEQDGTYCRITGAIVE